jgi:hypothetical protein
MLRIQVVTALNQPGPEDEVQLGRIPYRYLEFTRIGSAQSRQFSRQYPGSDEPDIVIELLMLIAPGTVGHLFLAWRAR